MYYRPDLAAPERLSLREAALVAARGIRKLGEIRRAVRKHRLERLKDEPCNGRVAAWALCVPPHRIRQLIDDGLLPAEKLWDDAGRYRWEIYPADVAALAEEIE